MIESPPDAVLARAARSGDPVSLGALLERHRPRMLAVAVSMVGHGPQAEDAVQDALVIAVRRIGDLRDPDAVRAWLIAIVANACRAHLRRAAPEPRPDGDGSLEAPAPDAVERAIEASALRDWVWTALERLSEPLRVAVVLRYFSNATSYGAIAEVCGVPVGTVRSRLSSAKARLAEELLATAGGEHVHPGGAHDPHGVRIGAAMERFTRDGDRAALGDAFAADLSFVMFDRVERSGLDDFAAAVERDLDDGVRVEPIRAVSGSDITVFEGWLRSPPENPLHCPPAFTQVYHHPGDGRARRVVAYYAPLPGPRP